MHDCDKVIIVIYIGLKKLPAEDRRVYFDAVAESAYRIGMDETITKIIVPDEEHDGIRVECINPKVVSEEDFAETKAKIERLEAAIREMKGDIKISPA